MSVIIRLQNLPWSANALDIRQYFNGLSIPEGGVHIVGGELGDAFIAFSTDEDARQAMLIDGGKIKEVKIKLYLSSRSEMQKVIETARAQSISLQNFMQVPSPQIAATPLTATQIPPTPPQTAPAMPPMPPISQIPVKTTTPDIKPPPLPPLPSVPTATAPEPIKTEPEIEKKDQDTESVSSRDAKRSRRRSRSKSKNRSKSSDRSKSRERSKSRDRSRSRERSYRSKDRYRDRRRRDRSRSRDRRDRRRYRDRSKSRDRSSRKSSRDRKRDTDRNDRSSIENSSGSKNVISEKDREIPLPSTPSIPASTAKPGFITSGWVSADTADKAAVSILPSTIGFTIGKSPTNVPTPQPPSQPPAPRLNMVSPQQIPLPQQMQISPQQMQIPHQMQTPQQVPTTQPIPVTHPMQMPQPPIFPPIPKLEASKDQDGTLFPPMPFPTAIRQPPNIPTTQQNVLIGRSQQPQMPRNEPNNMLQNDPGLLSTSSGWPLMDHNHMISSQQIVNSGANQAPTYQANALDKSAIHMPMNVGMGMYIPPPSMPTNENFKLPYMQQDPRMQNTFNTLQPRSDFISSERTYPQLNNFSLQKQSNYGGREYDPTNQRDLFSNTCVEIRNMSMNTTNPDIHRFFQGLQIPGDGVKIITDKKGNKVGIAYVRFSKLFFKEMALKKTGQTLKNSIVEVLHIDDSIFNKATDFSEYSGNYIENSKSYQDNYNDNFNTQHIPTEPFMDIVIHDVPPYTKDREIYNLFKGYKISDAFVLLRTGRKTATAYVKFNTTADARKALVNSSRLTIGYTNVKAAVCYEHEFADARDRKNMEENDEEMMDSKDVGYLPNETRTRGLEKYPPYDYNQDRSDPRYNKTDNRAVIPKGLLPTPSYNPFDPRSPAHNSNTSSTSNYPSRFDRRQPDIQPPRMPREDFHKKPYGREDLYQTPFPRENSRFQQKPIPRDDQHKKQVSPGEFYKNTKPHGEFYSNLEEQGELCKKIQPPQYPSSTAKSAFSSDGPPATDKGIFNPKLPVINSGDKINNKNEKPNEAKCDPAVNNTTESVMQDKAPLVNLHQNAELNVPAKIVPPNNHPVKQTEEVISQNEKSQPVNSENKGGPEATSDQIKEDMDFIDTDCIILRGLPFSATDRDILDFFSDEGLAPTQIHIMLDKQEQPAGDAFCEFNTVEEVTRAITKNKTLMGRSLVSVEPVTKEEMMEALGAIDAHSDHPHPDFPSDYPRKDNRFLRMPSSSGYPPHFLSRGRGRGAFRSRHFPSAERELETQNVSSFGKPGCVVALENVPFRAEVQDILDFFRGFYVHRDNVIRRFDEHGKATGDARVCFSSPLEAQRAIRTLNFRQIFNRQIHLSMVPH